MNYKPDSTSMLSHSAATSLCLNWGEVTIPDALFSVYGQFFYQGLYLPWVRNI